MTPGMQAEIQTFTYHHYAASESFHNKSALTPGHLNNQVQENTSLLKTQTQPHVATTDIWNFSPTSQLSMMNSSSIQIKEILILITEMLIKSTEENTVSTNDYTNTLRNFLENFTRSDSYVFERTLNDYNCKNISECKNAKSSLRGYFSTFIRYSNATQGVTYPDKIHKQLTSIIITVIIIVGTVTNVMSILVLIQKSFRTTAMSFYLITLAVVDTLVLYFGPGYYTLTYVSVHTPSSDAECIIFRFMVVFLKQVSAWTTVNLGLERTTAVMCSLSCTEWFTKLKAANYLIIHVLILLMLNIQTFWMYGFVNKFGVCMYAERWYHINVHIWPIVELVLYAVLPIIMLIVCNSVICGTLYRLHLLQNSHVSTTDAPAKLRRTILVLFTLTIAFIVTTLPHSCASMYIFSGETVNAFLHKLASILISLQYVNYACKFFLYCICGSKFRRELLALCKCCRVPQVESEDEKAEKAVVVGTKSQPLVLLPNKKNTILHGYLYLKP